MEESNGGQAGVNFAEDSESGYQFGEPQTIKTTEEIKIENNNAYAAAVDDQVNTKDANIYVRLRGLPYSAGAEDVKKFLSEIPVHNVYFTEAWDGRPTGECYVCLQSNTDVPRALTLHRETMQTDKIHKPRYVEVFEVGQSELDRYWSRQHSSSSSGDSCVVRVRGLPFGCNEQQLREFFQGLEVSTGGVVFEHEPSGRPTGEAFIRFQDSPTAEAAFAKHLHTLGHRYVEVFRSTEAEFRRANPDTASEEGPMSIGGSMGGGPVSLLDMPLLRPPPGFQPGGGPPPRRPPWPPSNSYYDEEPSYGGDWGPPPPRPMMPPPPRQRMPPPPPQHYPPAPSRPAKRKMVNQPSGIRLRMRGLPFKATYDDIVKFFAPVNVVDVSIQYNDSGQPSGEAYVDFDSVQSAQDAMKRDRQHMGQRWIELFMDDGPSAVPKKLYSGPVAPGGAGPAPYEDEGDSAWNTGLNAQGQVQYPSMYGGAQGGYGGQDDDNKQQQQQQYYDYLNKYQQYWQQYQQYQQYQQSSKEPSYGRGGARR